MTSSANSIKDVIDSIDGAMIVSCQASKGEPLCHPDHILALSLSGINGGARGLRLEGVENIARVRRSLDSIYEGNVPIVGLTKSEISPEEKLTSVYITASFADAKSLAEAGADIIALDATGRKRSDGMTLKETIERIHSELNKAVWADCATFGEGLAAHEAGADIISTTLYGYTAETALPKEAGPGLDLLKEFIAHIKGPIILEGRIWHPEELTRAFELGAHAVVVGSAITRPQLITERFVKAIPSRRVRRTAFQPVNR
ncbi:MAG: N-acetylmannosamine-6-phosphate 2-epimerase [Cyanobacteria bacterium SZAS TMP-1]|nr:N-acetylmannosamine-6-phosphate 2-epimerase [Cyanobacteria bacterium SZAS TMP-1]